MIRLFTLLLVAAAIAYMTPVYAIHKLDAALEAENPAAVDQYVDFDAVKAYVQNTATQAGGGNGTIGGALAGGLAGLAANLLATPDIMVNALKDKPDRLKIAIDGNMLNTVKRGYWNDLDHFVARNPDGKATLLLTRTGLSWEVTGIRAD